MNGSVAAEWRTPEEVAAELKVPVEAVEKLIAEKRLAAVRVGDALRIRSSALERYLDRANLARPRLAWAARVAVGAAAAAAAVAVAVVAAASGPRAGEVVPRQIPYRGVLELNGAPAPSGTVDMEFRLYDTPTGGNALNWSERQNVPVQDGQFAVEIGEVTAIPSSFFAQPSLYLQVAVNGQQLAGRQRLLTVPYAQQATTSRNVAGGGTVSADTVSATTMNATTLNAGAVHATGSVSGASLSTGSVQVGQGISGGNGDGNLHIDSNQNGGDGRVYLNWWNGKGVVVGNGGLHVNGNVAVGGGTLSVGGVDHEFRQGTCVDVVVPRGNGARCPNGYYVAGVIGAQSGDWLIWAFTCCK